MYYKIFSLFISFFDDYILQGYLNNQIVLLLRPCTDSKRSNVTSLIYILNVGNSKISGTIHYYFNITIKHCTTMRSL